ncbi:hypothetical protein C7999DRAFT_33608 [Corynascus novoguineensis]|uniref:Uncharacterized protein n=1 Tax=Corynascus novoguineensis TaxID=1126955 RepID=A0AAN7CSD2_9PEZI|nr:hypothetical protein C7999DRAFT_33608 [Corynascus novoguineensis]
MDESNESQTIPRQLFHTTLTVIDFHHKTSCTTKDVYVLGTHTTLPAAESFALGALELLGYQAGDFDEYATRVDTPVEKWKHGHDVLVCARGAPEGREFLIGVVAKPNTESLPEGEGHTLKLPEGGEHLYYVLKSTIDFNQDKSDSFQTSEILGCYERREDALVAAKKALQRSRGEYAQYDERDEDGQDGAWPFGDEVVVHAVTQTGQDRTVAVKTFPGALKKYGKERE